MATRHRVFQTGLISSLASGVFEDDMSLAELLGEGSMGLGTFNQLDGEMVILDGVCYQLRSDGTVTQPGLDARTPYAVVTNFVPSMWQEVKQTVVRHGISEIIDAMLPSRNYMYAIRITGDFAWVTTRTVERQEKPYPTLVQATDGEDVVRFENVRGVVAGFRTPLFEAAISVAGCHAHFIDDERTRGGHLIDFEMHHGVAEICLGTDLALRLPLTAEFGAADLTPEDLQAQLHKAEHAQH